MGVFPFVFGFLVKYHSELISVLMHTVLKYIGHSSISILKCQEIFIGKILLYQLLLKGKSSLQVSLLYVVELQQIKL